MRYLQRKTPWTVLQHHHRASNHSTYIKPGYLCIIADSGRKESMNYKRLSNDELNQCKYPNLVAEIIESGYSTSTIADFMGIGAKKNGAYREENDPEVWDKINGSEELPASHAIGLCKYYNCDYEYLFSSKLYVISDRPAAYWHWYDENKRKEREFQQIQGKFEVYNILGEKPYMIDCIKEVIAYIDGAEDSIEAIQKLTNALNTMKGEQ